MEFCKTHHLKLPFSNYVLNKKTSLCQCRERVMVNKTFLRLLNEQFLILGSFKSLSLEEWEQSVPLMMVAIGLVSFYALLYVNAISSQLVHNHNLAPGPRPPRMNN